MDSRLVWMTLTICRTLPKASPSLCPLCHCPGSAACTCTIMKQLQNSDSNLDEWMYQQPCAWQGFPTLWSQKRSADDLPFAAGFRQKVPK